MTSPFGARERARHHGIDSLSDAELVALVLGTGRRGEPAIVVSTALLAESGGVCGLLRRGPGGLARGGVGEAKGMRVAAAVELGRRANACQAAAPLLADSSVVAEWGQRQLGHLDHEELWLLAMDGQRRLRAARCVARGGLHGLGLHVRDPLRIALREGASGIVLVHNHPSGDPTPSPQDVEFTVRFAAACEIVATPLVDHVVIGHHEHSSMLALGHLQPTRTARGPPRRPRQKRAS